MNESLLCSMGMEEQECIPAHRQESAWWGQHQPSKLKKACLAPQKARNKDTLGWMLVYVLPFFKHSPLSICFLQELMDWESCFGKPHLNWQVLGSSLTKENGSEQFLHLACPCLLHSLCLHAEVGCKFKTQFSFSWKGLLWPPHGLPPSEMCPFASGYKRRGSDVARTSGSTSLSVFCTKQVKLIHSAEFGTGEQHKTLPIFRVKTKS